MGGLLHYLSCSLNAKIYCKSAATGSKGLKTIKNGADLVGGVDHVGFGTFLRVVSVSQLHVEQIEDKPVESRAQTVTEAPDSSDHPLDHTWVT